MLVVAAVSMTVSLGCAGAYHALHYNSVARSLHEHPKNFYHSGHTGRIVAKHHQTCPVEPPCYGYEPTCWRRWPVECENCPIADEVIQGEVILPGTRSFATGNADAGGATVDPEPERAIEETPEESVAAS